ncbi:MAG: YkvI family membrane protein [Bacilli bacterium]
MNGLTWRKFQSALAIASIYIGTVIGAGFATGKEIVTFFASGLWGTAGIICSGFLFCWLGTKMMLLAKKWTSANSNEFNYRLFGNKLGTLVNALVFIILLGVTSIMFSGVSSIFSEQLHFPKWIGLMLFVIVLSFFLFRGMQGLVEVNGLVVPMMLLFTLYITFTQRGNIHFSIPDSLWSDWEWSLLYNPFLYVAFNLLLAQNVLIPLANHTPDRSTILLGGWIGGAGLFVLMMLVHASLGTLDSPLAYDIPMGAVVQKLSALLHFIFTMVMIAEVFTTVTGNIFGMSTQFRSDSNHHHYQHGATVIILFICLLLSGINYSKLLTLLYPLFGWMSIMLMPLLVYHARK